MQRLERIWLKLKLPIMWLCLPVAHPCPLRFQATGSQFGSYSVEYIRQKLRADSRKQFFTWTIEVDL